MPQISFVNPDELRAMFSRALSAMYRAEVPLYGTLLDLVADVNAECLHESPALAKQLNETGQLSSLDIERHGAIRLGTAQELSTMARLFAAMGMEPVAYYDLALAGIPVHATAFRPTNDAALAYSPFRVFTSLLRLDLLTNTALRDEAARILGLRQIFTPRCIELIEKAQVEGGMGTDVAEEFVAQALETFRWHGDATVDIETYRKLRAAHPLIADVVCFKGPHINHLTPRVLDIDAAQSEMRRRAINAKDKIEGPPKRKHPILLRQTSFLALEEPIRFPGRQAVEGTHTARFGEIEQRGIALTRKGRELYDKSLAAALQSERDGVPTEKALAAAFAGFPDDLEALRRERLAFFRYRISAVANSGLPSPDMDVDELLSRGWLAVEPVVYQDFLPVSAAGIFRSNLGSRGGQIDVSGGDKGAFEAALGRRVVDEFALYQAQQDQSLDQCLQQLRRFRAASIG
ncbi:VOC family protein [Variovorax ureilyticus]|uniref:2-oxoadipate dioxygenase/decarboxylase n=1 Tax=Variovorax ureilyticus TaxID=1836198 RepID=A0ABU8VNS4_9BURK